ncbi:hypothetical protein [Pararhizobium sp. DWP3-4]|uniref:hypothetical protein n=1 Tax=Pararhizobium sp. DWP3-4 TaxID=2804565 RepID=UPI003CEFAEEC
MQTIDDWLDDRVQDVIGVPGLHYEKADFQPQAKQLWIQAQAAGYSATQLKDACGGDVEQYLVEQQNAMTDVARQR